MHAYLSTHPPHSSSPSTHARTLTNTSHRLSRLSISSDSVIPSMGQHHIQKVAKKMKKKKDGKKEAKDAGLCVGGGVHACMRSGACACVSYVTCVRCVVQPRHMTKHVSDRGNRSHNVHPTVVPYYCRAAHTRMLLSLPHIRTPQRRLWLPQLPLLLLRHTSTLLQLARG